jgi:hypothetical protein
MLSPWQTPIVKFFFFLGPIQEKNADRVNKTNKIFFINYILSSFVFMFLFSGVCFLTFLDLRSSCCPDFLKSKLNCFHLRQFLLFKDSKFFLSIRKKIKKNKKFFIYNHMRYLKLYEAFSSKGISKTINFLSQKISSQSKDKFLNDLKEFMQNSDYPLNKLTDDFIQYLPFKKAILLKKDKDVSNGRGIWAIKYWFSVEGGYLGYTATGNKTYPFREPQTINNSSKRKDSHFTNRELEYIKKNITETGIISRVTDYSKLKTGQVVIGIFGGDIGIATVYVDNTDRVYAIQNVASGSYTSDSGWREYTEYGDQSWYIYEPRTIPDDHEKLNFYTPGDEPLRYEEKEEPSQSENLSHLNWNLPLDENFNQVRWSDYIRSISSYKEVGNADFALVLMYDDLLNPDVDAPYFEPVSDIKKFREESKSGSTHFMTDEEITKSNYNRLMDRLISIYGLELKSQEQDLLNLQKLFSTFLCGEKILYSLIAGEPDTENIYKFEQNIKYLITCEDDEESKKWAFEKVKKNFFSYKEESKKYADKFSGSLKRVQNEGDEETIEIFDKLSKISKKILQFIFIKPVTTLNELRYLLSKIHSISYYYKKTTKSEGLNKVFDNIKYNDSDVSDGVERMAKRTQVEIEEDRKFVDELEKYILQLLG